MPTTTYKQYPLPTQGVTTTWGDALNNYPFTDIDRNLGGIVTKSVSSSNIVLTDTESQSLIIRLIGTLTANVGIVTTCQGMTLVENLTSGGYSVTITNSVTYGGAGVGTPVALPQGGRYVVASDTTNGSRLVLPAASSVASTVGMIGYFPGRTAPSGWLKANGDLVSRTTYAALFNWAIAYAMTTEATWGAGGYQGWFAEGDGSTTFRLPDLRGTFVRSWADDKTSSINYGRDAGTFQDQSLENHQHTGTTGGQSATHSHEYTTYTFGAGGPGGGGGYMANPGAGTTGNASSDHGHYFTTDAAGNGNENRPQSIAMMTCIAYV